jgi:hypothetical protein
MKVQSEQPTKITKAPIKISPEEVKARIMSKFGKDLNKKKPIKVEDKVELSKREASKSSEKVIGDVGKNDPTSEETHSKIRHMLKAGTIHISDRERQALSKILK